MGTINYITDSKGNKTGLILNDANELEQIILEYWINQTDENKNRINLLLANFLIEIGSNEEKDQLREIINTIKSENSNSTYTIKGKKLAPKEYSDYILKLSDEAHAGIGTMTHNQVNEEMSKYIANKKQDAKDNLER